MKFDLNVRFIHKAHINDASRQLTKRLWVLPSNWGISNRRCDQDLLFCANVIKHAIFTIVSLPNLTLSFTEAERPVYTSVTYANIVSDNGLSPGRRQAIIWTIAGKLLIGPLVTNFREILIKIDAFLFNKMHLKLSSRKWRSFCVGLSV